MSRRSERSTRIERVGRYALLVELASGGMGRVYLGRASGDAGFDRLVALKRIHPHLAREPEVYAMVSDEARIGSLVRHPNVIGVVDVVDAGDDVLLVLDYVEGAALSELVREVGVLPLPILARVAIDALRGLHAAHEAKNLLGEPLEVVHRDVSPQNLLVGVDGTTRILDFGIATGLDRAATTRTGVVKGKLRHLSPEQIEGEAQVDRRADVFAMGTVLFERIAGVSPFDGADESSRMARVLLGNVDFARVAERAPTMVPVLERALARRPGDRFATALEMAQAIRAATDVAEPEDVAALVGRAMDGELRARRERLEEALLRLAEEDDDAGDAPPVDGVPGEDRTTVVPTTTPARRPRWLGIAGLAILGANVAGWVLVTRSSPPVDGATSADVRLSTVPSASADVAPTPMPTPTLAPTASASIRTTVAAPLRPPASASASASARSELQQSPYGTVDGGVR